jgi:RNA polymerase sigma-70 factor (ECF subfamily)
VSESELITRARQKDEAAWETLVKQHQEKAFRLAYLLMGDADEAEDIVQEAFIRALGNMERFDTTRPFRPWLLSITANLARNRHRTIARYLAALSRLLRAEPAPASNTGEASSVQECEAQILWQAVRRLSTNDQEIIYLRYFLDLSEAEMAATLNIAPGTVKSRLHRALKRLRVDMKNAGEDWPAQEAYQEG